MSSDLNLPKSHVLELSCEEKLGQDTYFLDWHIYGRYGKFIHAARYGGENGLTPKTPPVEWQLPDEFQEGRLRLFSVVRWKGKSYERGDAYHSLSPYRDKKKKLVENTWRLRWGRGGDGGCVGLKIEIKPPRETTPPEEPNQQKAGSEEKPKDAPGKPPSGDPAPNTTAES